MKRFFSSLALFLSLTSIAKEIDVPSKISSVTVFRSKAEIVRHASLNLSPGAHELIFNNVEKAIEASSIQTAAKGNLILLGVHYELDYLANKIKPYRLKEMEDSLEMLNYDKEVIVNKIDILSKEEEVILANQKIGGEEGLSVGEIEELSDFIRERLTNIRTTKIKLNITLKNVKKYISKLKNQIRQSSRGNDPVGKIVVKVKVNAATKGKFELKYIVKGAGWTPNYDIRADDSKNSISLLQKANVWQNTGIDWNKVKLTLSTAKPAQGGTRPYLTPWYVWVKEPVKKVANSRRGVVNRASSSVEEFAEEEIAFGDDEDGWGDDWDEEDDDSFLELSESTSSYTATTENALSVEYNIAIPYDIPATGVKQLVEVKQIEMDCEFAHYCAPNYDKDAFLVAKVAGWEKYDILAGNASIYLNGTFVGNTYLNVNATTDKLDVSLGRDPKVIVKREKLTDFTTKRTVGSSIKQDFGYKITIKNLKSKPIQLQIQDQLPVSKNNDIEVEATVLSEGVQNESLGYITWDLKLESSESKELEYKYTVKYPKSKIIENL